MKIQEGVESIRLYERLAGLNKKNPDLLGPGF
jgi:hypothetical protein